MSTKREEMINLLNKLQHDPNNRFYIDYFSEKDKNPFEWKTVLEGSIGSIYENGYYMIKIRFTENYPQDSPKIFFLNRIFHPHINQSDGYACISPFLPIRPRDNNIISVLECVDNFFINYDSCVERAYSQEPLYILMKDRDEFIKIAKKWVKDYAKIEDLNKYYDI